MLYGYGFGSILLILVDLKPSQRGCKNEVDYYFPLVTLSCTHDGILFNSKMVILFKKITKFYFKITFSNNTYFEN